MAVVVIALHGGLFDGAVHALDLTVGSGVVGFGHAMLNTVDHACAIEQVHAQPALLHRCLASATASADCRLPQVEGDKPMRKAFKSYPIGYFHIDIAEVRTAQGKLYLFMSIDCTSKFAFVRDAAAQRPGPHARNALECHRFAARAVCPR